MWILTMFDLPVVTKAERKAANEFRLFLLDQGFEKAQLSVYMRFCTGKEQVNTICQRIKQEIPEGGKIDILTITDKQYENIISFAGKVRQRRKNPDQFSLF
jgi:CRISPR-associated protein Cas2